MDTESAGNLAYGFSFFQKPFGKVALFLVHLFWPSEANSASFGISAASASMLPDVDRALDACAQ
jgi:hypothetical protein